MSMHETPYSQLPGTELILRDYLAAHRTVLANDRTVLAYIRTTLTFLIGGVTFIQFFESALVRAVGWSFVPLAAVVLLVGSLKYVRMNAALGRIGADGPQEASHPGAHPAGDDQQ